MVAVVDIVMYRASRVVQIAVAVVDIILYRASRVVQSGGSG